MSATVATRGLSERQRFARFLAAGGFAAAVNLGSRAALSGVLVYELAVVAAYLLGTVAAYLVFRRFVFAPTADGSRTRRYAAYAAVNAVALTQVWLVSVGLARIVFPVLGFEWHAETVAHCLGVASPVVTSYLGHRRLSFR